MSDSVSEAALITRNVFNAASVKDHIISLQNVLINLLILVLKMREITM